MKKLESGEMYLESIFVLKNSIKKVHATDVANFLQYSKPSVSRALGILRDSNLIVVGKDGAIDFTDEGLQYANSIYEKHKVLTRFLCKMGVSESVAEKDACRMEHVISEETFLKIKQIAEGDN
ncbi:MAG TPA: metal-dependent transcriptional regulator [Candidatus Limihabitans stercoravium]|nr:metal-dependent transcriptional regulator [Candidatus Limihabitans stercoravium]